MKVVLMITTMLGVVMPMATMMRVVLTRMIAIMIMIMYEPYADDGNEDTSYANKQNDVVPYAHVCPGSPNETVAVPLMGHL